MDIILATNNDHKRIEIQQIFSNHNILVPKDLGISFDHDETAKTFRDNALEKAKALYEIVKKPVLADDSGICVPALGGAPGIYSARYGSDIHGRMLESEERNNFLLKNMQGKKNRSAYFVCAMALVLDSERYYIIQETFNGELIEESLGDGGFGYDPIFYLPERKKTAAQLTSEEKNRISHRGKACKAMSGLLNTIEE